MIIQKKNRLALVLLAVILAGDLLTATTLPQWSTRWSWFGLNCGSAAVPGAYRSYTSSYMELHKIKDITLWQENEFELYLRLIRRSVQRPGFLLAEGTLYPVPWLAAWLEKSEPVAYRNFNIGEKFNIIKSLGAGYQEPWSVSFFLGQLDNFWSIDEDDQWQVVSSGAAGLVLTGGNIQLFDNYPVPSNWWRIEWKVKGQGRTNGRKRVWDMKLGYRNYGLPMIGNTVFLVLTRRRTNLFRQDWQIQRNSASSVEIQVPIGETQFGFTRFKLEYGKVRPFREKILIGIKIGFLYEYRSRYDHLTERFLFEQSRSKQFYIQPLVLF